jgi:pSer/pThr/pTyr-binding forkhead associated (FHA) protein
VVRGASPGQTFDVRLDREILVGRSPECDLTVDGDDTMSGRHFRLFLAGSRLVVEDAGSANGTAVNGAPISGEYPLTDGDLIAAGHTQLRISMEETAP